MQRILDALGLRTKETRAWAMYDWANSAFITVVITAVFPIYYQTVAAKDLEGSVATTRYTLVTSLALLLVAVLSPILGALADFKAHRKRFLSIWLVVGVAATAGLWFVKDGGWVLGLVLFAIGNLAVLLTIVFNDSLLPHITEDDEVDRVSTAGYALGYLGGGLLLAAVLVMVLKPDIFGLADGAIATRLGFILTAIWWLVFALPVLMTVKEPPRELEADEAVGMAALSVVFSRLGETLSDLKNYKHAFVLLIAVLIYNDGVSTIYRLATTYGTEIGLPQNDLIAAVLLVQFVGVPFAFLFGFVAKKIGAKRGILVGLCVYLVISCLGYFVQTSAHFFAMAIGVATVQGGVQALSRSLFASMVPAHKSSEFFGFFGVAERFAAILGPVVFGAVTAATGSSRYAIVSIVMFFLVGGAILLRVDVEEGQRVAKEMSKNLKAVTP